jgi:serine protease Do
MDAYEQKNHIYFSEQDRQPPTSSYVYPQPAYPAGPQPDQGGKPPKKSSARTIGLVALILAVAVLFSAVTGELVYTIMKNQPAASQTASETTKPQTTSYSQQTTAAGNETTKDSNPGDVNNKHFSLADAAARLDPNKKTLSIIEIATVGKPAVVAINTSGTMTDPFGQSGNYEAAGSGFIITKDGYIVTNNHVIEGAETITAVLDDGSIYDAKLVGRDERNDIAVIKISASNLPTAYLGDSSDLQVGELAVAIGNPLGELSGTVTAGIISAMDRLITLDGQSMHLLQTDAAINAGNSGGALFNSFGEVIGINTAKNTGSGVEGLGFAIPIDVAKPIIESLIQYGYVQGRPKIGISTRDISKQMAEYYRMEEGIYILEVERNSAAEEAGLRKADIIVAANSKEMLTTEELTVLKDTLKPGDSIELTIMRNGNRMKVTVVLKEDIPSDVTQASFNGNQSFI